MRNDSDMKFDEDLQLWEVGEEEEGMRERKPFS